MRVNEAGQHDMTRSVNDFVVAICRQQLIGGADPVDHILAYPHGASTARLDVGSR